MKREEMIKVLNNENVRLNMTDWEKDFVDNTNIYESLSGKQITILYDMVLKYTKEGIK